MSVRGGLYESGLKKKSVSSEWGKNEKIMSMS